MTQKDFSQLISWKKPSALLLEGFYAERKVTKAKKSNKPKMLPFFQVIIAQKVHMKAADDTRNRCWIYRKHPEHQHTIQKHIHTANPDFPPPNFH